MDKTALQSLIEARLTGTGYSLITLEVSSANDILVEVDSLTGVDLDFCAELNQYLTSELDSNAALRGGVKAEDWDYSLEVGSVSLTDPFKTRMQYDKNLGHEVEVLAHDGKKYVGQLVSVDDESFAIDSEEMVVVEGKKRRQKQLVTRTFGYMDVKYTRYNLKV